ncbi:MAG: hypothetical protein R3F54_26560 [Alphaproteobacteria bacterium]
MADDAERRHADLGCRRRGLLEGQIIRGVALSRIRQRSFRACRVWMSACASVLLSFVIAADAESQTLSRAAVRAQLDSFFDVFLDRRLSAEELDQVTKGYIGLFGSQSCADKCARVLASHMSNADVMRTKRGEPEALMLRHAFVVSAYFDPMLRGTLGSRLLAEPDPVRVVDPDAKRLMTEKDVVALVNLLLFLQSDDAPSNRDVPPDRLGQAVELLDSKVGSRSGARQMPWFFGAAAAFWAGLRREWPDLNAEERQAARDYVQQVTQRLSASPMSVHLYGRLLGVSNGEARQLHELDEMQAQLADIRASTSHAIDAAGMAIIGRKVIDGMQDAIE